MGPRRLFLIADAEELVAQESSPEAANALLKLLEEPPGDTWFVLTASEPGRLLPTVRSRSTAVFLPPLPLSRVRDFLIREWHGAEEDIERAVGISGGSIGRALGFLPDGEALGPLETIRQEAFFLLRAALDPGAAQRFSRAIGFAHTGARGLHEILASLEGWIRDLAAVAAGADAAILNQGAGARHWLLRAVRERELAAVDLARAVGSVEEARGRAAGNVNPQLLIFGLLSELHETLVGPGDLATTPMHT
jgi:DNA polymerase-3 subunit delta'